MRERDSRASGLAVTVAVFATIASLVVAGVIAAFLIMHVTGSPEETATTFLTDWQIRAYGEMDAVTLNAPKGGVAGPLRATAAQLGRTSPRPRPSPPARSGNTRASCSW